MKHLATAALEAGLGHIRESPSDRGRVDLIVRRPDLDKREVLEEGQLSRDEGLVGDSWLARGSRRTEDGSPHRDMQINVINARCIALLASHRDRWPLAGDQLYVDLDLSRANLPSGSRLSLGSAAIEVTDQPHRACAKFSKRFGIDALRFVNSESGQQLRLRGLNAKVVQSGTVLRGDVITKIWPTDSLS